MSVLAYTNNITALPYTEVANETIAAGRNPTASNDQEGDPLFSPPVLVLALDP
jgi:hypothetical protein